MGKRAPRFNQKARSSSLPATALPHPNPRDAPAMTESGKKMSKKKRIRFEKFVERQLKKENRIVLMEKLKEFKTNDLFQSSKDLGKIRQVPESAGVSNVVNSSRKSKPSKKGNAATLTVYSSSSEEGEDAEDVIEMETESSDIPLNNSMDTNPADTVCVETHQVTQTVVSVHGPVLQSKDPVKKDLAPYKPAFYVPVLRKKEFSVARMSLPVVGEEQLIMETIMENDVTVLCSETGSGKTTQLPQFLYEAGFGHPDHPSFSGIIGITQPRRVAAVSMASRVSQEMNLFDGEVSYQIRYDKGQLNHKTRIKFMTDGILLRELSQNGQSDSKSLLLADYSCIIIDEAHERTVGTDILLGWLTRVVKVRNSGRIDGINPLKLVIMSATLRVEDFTENRALFPQAPPPVINIPGRQHKVVVHYNRNTSTDYVKEAFKKASKIHSKFPPGGILIFVTGQHEVQMLVRKLRAAFSVDESNFEDDQTKEGVEDLDLLMENQLDSEDDYDVENVSDIDSESVQSEEDNIEILNGTFEDEDVETLTENEIKNRGPMHVLPLYSLLSKQAQLRVFAEVPEGSRLVVVATNIAETSLTIPGIKYVIDCGKSKERLFDPKTGLQRFCIDWTSKAAADQRAGRAGRVGPGHCYRLYSSAVFSNYFPEFATPEISRVPLDGVILQMKAVGIQNILNFPFPTPPDSVQLKSSYDLLKYLDALDKNDSITSLGQKMSYFPISPRYSKILVVASKQSRSIFEYAICLVSGLSVGSPFIHLELEQDEEDEEKRHRRSSYYRVMQTFSGSNPTSDSLKLLSAIGAYKCHVGNRESFCENHFLSFKTMEEIDKLICQITKIAHKVLGTPLINTFSKPPTLSEQQQLLQLLLTGNPDRIAKLVSIDRGMGIYETIDSNNSWYIHSSSCLSQNRPSWIIYLESITKSVSLSIDQESTIGASSDKFYLNSISSIEPSWIAQLVPKTLLKSGKILEQPIPRYDSSSDSIIVYVSPKYGPKSWPLSIQSRPLLSSDPESTLLVARFLLQGKLFQDFSFPRLRFNPSLLSSSRGLLLGKPFILNLLSSLEGVLSVNDFTKQLSDNSNWLLPQLLDWIHEEDKEEFKCKWMALRDKILRKNFQT